MTREESLEAARRLEAAGWGVTPPDQHRIDVDPRFVALWREISEYTMTSFERGYALYEAVRYVTSRSIPGDFVECGVWKGGSCMLMAKTLLSLGVTDRRILLYDTFAGMTEPTEHDVIAWNGKNVSERFERFASWAVGVDSVRANVETTGYPPQNFEYVEGDVSRTLRSRVSDRIALLRLDTDWYESTKVELEVLYPRLAEGGALIIDDYGHFLGARKAVDEYFSANPAPLFARVDYTGRVAVKVS